MSTITNKEIYLSNELIFSSGGNRICYHHPKHHDRCLKVLRPDRLPHQRRAAKHWLARLLPLSYYDENRVEYEALQYLHHTYSDTIRQHLPTSYGIKQTNHGWAHETTLVRDRDGLISQTLEQYIWENGLDQTAQDCIARFKKSWESETPNTRALIPHNMVIQRDDQDSCLILIDGFGRKPSLSRVKSNTSNAGLYKRRISDFDARIKKLIQRKAQNNGPTERLENLMR